MDTMSDDAIDALLLSQATSSWQKVAMVIGKALQVDRSLVENKLGERIAALVESGRLESDGDIRNWRHSEIRLPAK